MSQKQNAAALPDVETAYNTLFAGIDQRAFFSKLASAGYSPRTNAEAQQLLELGAQLEAVAEHDHVKAAADAQSPFLAAKQALDRHLGGSGLDAAYRQRQIEDAEAVRIKVARDLAQDPTLYNSVLVLKAAEAAELANLPVA